jgi:hypothetical protein
MGCLLLFDLLRPWTWTQGQAANVISFFAASGTVGALAYAYILERKNRKKINDLANIVQQLVEANQIFREQTCWKSKK